MILQLYALAKEYKTCGNTAMYAATVAQLQSVLDNSGECSCGCCDESQDVPYWVDNSNLDATSIIAQLQSEIDALNLQVGGLENAVQNNASALAAYNTLIGNINTYNTDLLTILAELNVVQAAALALNPSSPSFEADVDVLIANVDTIETNFLLLNDQLNDLLVEVVAFNEDYPEFASYTITLYEQLQASAETTVTIQAVIDQLQASLATLTPSTYNDEIEDIWDAIESLQIDFSLLTQQVGIALASIESIQVTLASLIEQNTSLQFEINTLTATVNGLNKFLILGFYVDDEDSANLFIPADWLDEKIFYKFSIKGVSTDPAAQIKIGNSNIATSIFGVAVANNAYDIQLSMCYVPADGVWKIGGTSNIGGSLGVIGDFSIDPVTLLPFNTPTVLVVSADALTNTFYAVDGFAYRQY